MTFIDSPRWENATHWFETPSCAFNKIGSGVTIDKTNYPIPERSVFEISSDHQEYIENCNPILHKTTLPNVKIETDEQWYDLQYCMWRPHYPDLSHIDDKDLMNNHAYCVELFDTLYDFHSAPGPNCGLQRYNEDGTTRAICEPKSFGAVLADDDNLNTSICWQNHRDWAHLTKANHIVYSVYDMIEQKQERRLDKVMESCACKAGNSGCLDYGVQYQNFTHSIDNHTCEWEGLK